MTNDEREQLFQRIHSFEDEECSRDLFVKALDEAEKRGAKQERKKITDICNDSTNKIYIRCGKFEVDIHEVFVNRIEELCK